MLPDEAGALRPYLVLHSDRDLYAVRPDGSDLHRILTQQPCFLPHIYGSAFFSPDGQWFICAGTRPDDTQRMARLPPRGEETQWTLFPVSFKVDWWDSAWAPDGRHVAASIAGQPCTVGLFDLSLTPASASLHLTRTLVAPELASSPFCELRWSPDGRYLALSEVQHDLRMIRHMIRHMIRQYIVDLRALPAPDSAREGAPGVTLSTADTPDAVRYLGAYDGSPAYGAVWLGDSSALLIPSINEDAQAVLARGVSGRFWEPLLQVPSQRARACARSRA